MAKREVIADVRRKFRDPNWYVRGMGIIDNRGRKSTLHNLREEQQQIVDSIQNHRRTCILKARQIGSTTVCCAALFHRALVSPHEYGVLSITHEGDAMHRVNAMMRNYWETTPKQWRPELLRDNSRELKLSHNGSAFRQSMAGGRGASRSFTFRALHATEMGFWPKGSSARAGKSCDEDVWASTLSTIHEDDDTRIVVESTADGPSGIFYKIVRRAMESDEWNFLFFPWYMFKEYRVHELPKGWERRDDEQELADLYGMDDFQLAWRRRKIEDDGYGLLAFRKEYPTHWEEPFLITGNLWYNAENLNIMLAGIPVGSFNDKKKLHIYEEPKNAERYFIGGDPSGGVGGDQAVWCVLNSSMEQVAIYACRRTPPTQFAEIGAKLSARYNRARMLVEKNNHGHATIQKLKSLGAPLWKDRSNKDWWTNPATKIALLDYSRSMIDGGYVSIQDSLTINEMLHIREQKNKNIEADEGYSDDRHMALALALWNARQQYETGSKKTREQLIAEQRRKKHRLLGLRR